MRSLKAFLAKFQKIFILVSPKKNKRGYICTPEECRSLQCPLHKHGRNKLRHFSKNIKKNDACIFKSKSSHFQIFSPVHHQKILFADAAGLNQLLGSFHVGIENRLALWLAKSFNWRRRLLDHHLVLRNRLQWRRGKREIPLLVRISSEKIKIASFCLLKRARSFCPMNYSALMLSVSSASIYFTRAFRFRGVATEENG